MKPGDTFEASVWLSGLEPAGVVDQYKKDMSELLSNKCRQHGLSHTGMRFTEKKPGDERVPVVPPHIDGPLVTLLVCEADIKPVLKVNSFLGDLDKKDLDRLRASTRAAFAKKFNGRRLSDEACDELIEHLGPEVAMAEVRRAVDSRVLH